MSTESPPRVRGSLILAVVRWLGLPLRSRQFWIVQAGVVLVAFLDEIVLDLLQVKPPFEMPRSTITALLLSLIHI